MVQIAKTLVEQPPSSLSSITKVKPRDSLKEVMLRSGQELSFPTSQEIDDRAIDHQENNVEDKPLTFDVVEGKKDRAKKSLVYLGTNQICPCLGKKKSAKGTIQKIPKDVQKFVYQCFIRRDPCSNASLC